MHSVPNFQCVCDGDCLRLARRLDRIDLILLHRSAISFQHSSFFRRGLKLSQHCVSIFFVLQSDVL